MPVASQPGATQSQLSARISFLSPDEVGTSAGGWHRPPRAIDLGSARSMPVRASGGGRRPWRVCPGYCSDVLHPTFAAMIETLHPSLERLRAMEPVSIDELPPVRTMPASGIYWLSEGSDSIYVGRSRRLRQRLQEHVRHKAGHNQASFAFLLAREMTGNKTASYQETGSRDDLLRNPAFEQAFREAKDRIRKMQLRFVEEPHPVRQCLLEVYVATAVEARYNDFDSH